MKATLRNSFAQRSILIAATTLPTLYTGLASAQTAAPAPAAPAPAPAAPMAAAATPAPIAAPVAPTPPPPPAVVTPPVSETPPAPADVPAPAPPVPPTDPDAEKYKHINMGIWNRTTFNIQGANPKKLNGIGMGGEVELHFSNQMRKYVAWTANLVATYGTRDGTSTTGSATALGDMTGSAGILDLIAQFEPDPAFNVWVGRMLVASDRSNFSGPYFMGPWIYPLWIGPQGTPYTTVGPREGFFGRNDGATVWGQFAGGLFKYYLGAYNLFDARQKPLISGRLNLSLLSPEPGYYSSSTYYGKDILAIGVGGQYQKNSDPNPAASDGQSDYGLFNADLLFEKDLQASGVVDVEGAFYKYIGDGEAMKFSYMALASYLTPDTGVGKFQPLVRIQQADFKDPAPTATQIDAQVGYVVDSYATRFALGYTHGKSGDSSSNAVFAGVQLQK